MAKKREFNVFSLSFLDIMSCGFGAVILIFIVIQHSTETTQQEINLELLAEIKKLEVEVLEGTKNLVEIKTTLKVRDDEIVTTEGLIMQIIQQINELQAQIAADSTDGASSTEAIEALKTELKQLEEEAAALEGSVAGEETSGSATRSFLGDGDRQYLSGIPLNGEHVLILLDASSSMLDTTIVNIIRRRNMDTAQKLASPKWQRALRTVDWIVANIPADSNVQLYTFNQTVTPIIEGSEASWIKATDRKDVNLGLEKLKTVVPTGGTSLHSAFASARDLAPVPDSIFLIIDSLPTMAFEPSGKSLISSRDRVRLFGSAMDELPLNIPVTVILFPMEGDPIAAPSYWRLAQITGGAFLSPPEDWP